MILIESGAQDGRSFDARVQFARQLGLHGHAALIDEDGVPEDLSRTRKYESAPFLGRIGDVRVTRLIVIGAETLSDAVLARLRGYRLADNIPVSAIGRFETRQARIGAASRLAYVLGREADLLDLQELQPRPIHDHSIAPLFANLPGAVSTVGAVSERTGDLRLFLVVPKDILELPETLPALATLGNIGGVNCNVITAGAGKELIHTSRYSAISAYGYSEQTPDVLARMSDVAAVFGPNIPGERMSAYLLDVLAGAGAAVDCTEAGAVIATGAPALRGPADIASLYPYLQASVLANRDAIGAEAASHPWLRENTFERLSAALALPDPARGATRTPKPRAPRVVFFPTNGVGLGHAQRCSLIAAELSRPTDCGFAAFPSCLPMLRAKGYDCLPLVAKSDGHAAAYANDLVNYLRLGQTLDARDTLVFDGGYVFDSVYKTILERQLSAVWIRRGLWQPGQLNHTPLDRERAFDAVILPDEAFDELNADYSHGARLHHVGPIVQRRDLDADARRDLRARLRARFAPEASKIVVTMLGGGEAADRSAQLQALCAQISARPDWLHLVVVWPNARVSANLYGWDNSHVVRTRYALDLCQASDLLVSAVGYNSFHEVLYSRIPTIFMPQMAAFMDDQERRARGASDRGLAVTVLADELLLLQREVAAFLDGTKAADIAKALAGVDLPAPGNARAARLIEEASQ
jgi:hypothetical protein